MRSVFRVSGSRDQRIAAIARLQRGRVARRQLLAAGINAKVIDRMLASGRLHPLHAGVYAVGYLADVEFGGETAALLAFRDGAVLSHRSAAGAWRLLAADPDDPVDVTVVGNRAGRREGIRPHCTRRLDLRDIRIHVRLPVTSPARALLELADDLVIRDLERALDEGIASRIVFPWQVAEVLTRSGFGRRGAPALAALLNDRGRGGGRTRSEGEDRFFGMLRAAQLPLPEKNAPLLGYTVDFLWREQGVVVEVDGYPWHSTKSAFERDHRKDAVLKAADIDVTRITWRQMDEEPFALIARLVQTLTRRAA